MHQTHKENAQKCSKINSETHIALLPVRTTPLGPGLPSPAVQIFNHPTKGIIPVDSRLPINLNNDNEHYKVLVKRQTKILLSMILPEIILVFP